MLQKCFCFDLETGGKIIAWYDIVSSVVFLISTISFSVPFLYHDSEIEGLSDHVDSKIFLGRIGIYIFLFFAVITCLGIIFVAVMLLVGIAKKSHKFFMFWLIFIGGGSFFALILWIKMMRVLIESYSELILVIQIIIIVSLIIHACFGIIIYSLFEKMRREAMYSGVTANPSNQQTVQYPASVQYVPQNQTGYTSQPGYPLQPGYPPQSAYPPQTGYPSQTGYTAYSPQVQPGYPTENAPAQYSSK